MSNDNEGPREGQENDASPTPKLEESSKKPVPLTALVGTGDPFLDELNRLSMNVDADVLRFRAQEEHLKGMACMREASMHMRMKAELLERADALSEQVREAEKNAIPDSSRVPVVPNDNRLPNERAESNTSIDAPFAILSDGKVMLSITHLQGRKVHNMRTWTGVMLSFMEAAEVKAILNISMQDAVTLVLPRVTGRLDL